MLLKKISLRDAFLLNDGLILFSFSQQGIKGDRGPPGGPGDKGDKVF